MQMSFGKKSLIASIAAAVALVVFAGTAAAAPVLQPGTTSAPGMSGTCTNCHTYASISSGSSSSSKSSRSAKSTSASVSHPYTGKKTYKASTKFLVFGYVTPKQGSAAKATVTLRVEKLNSRGKWSLVPTLTPTAAVSSKGTFKNKTNYKTSIAPDAAGKYRVRAKLVWKDSKGVKHSKTSKYYRFAISA